LYNAARTTLLTSFSWEKPSSKAFLNRSVRKGANQALAAVSHEAADNDGAADAVLGPVTSRELRSFTRKRLRKWGVTRLGDYVAKRLERRYDQELGFWGRTGYDRNRISATPSSWQKNRNKHWPRRAEYLLKLLGEAHCRHRRGEWFSDFLGDEPQWEERIIAWVLEARATRKQT
jgi:hypothetical protein